MHAFRSKLPEILREKSRNNFTTISKIKIRPNTPNPMHTRLHSLFTWLFFLIKRPDSFLEPGNACPNRRLMWRRLPTTDIRQCNSSTGMRTPVHGFPMILFLPSPLLRLLPRDRQLSPLPILYFPLHTTQFINLPFRHVRQWTGCHLFNCFVNWGTTI
jgi:hypothetical protein